MKVLIEKVERLDSIIRQFEKMISKMNAGQFIFAYRDANRMLAEFKEDRKNLIAMASDKVGEPKEEQPDEA